MTKQIGFDALQIDAEAVAEELADKLAHTVFKELRKRGAVVGISGGIDSAVCTALAAKALGSDRVRGLFMPERHSADETLPLSRAVAESQGITGELENLSPVLEALRCYERQDEAVRAVIPEYGPGWRFKIVLPSLVESASLRVYSVIAVSPDGQEIKKRMNPEAYLGVVAATNFKQRTRKMMEYYYADRLNYAVIGTPNRLEYDQGFFVKGGDGLADVKPIAHLYKSQVYQLAAALGVPEEIRKRPPTTDTYSLEQGQDEFYFSLPYDKMDLCLYAKNNGHPPAALTEALGLDEEQIGRVYKDIEGKRRTTRYLHLHPLKLAAVPEIADAIEVDPSGTA